MRVLLSCFLLLACCQCNDGNLEVKTIDFEGVSLDACTDDIATTVFFKVKNDESLILALQEGILQNAVVKVVSAIPAQSQFYYRFFKGSVSSAYFCSPIPPALPLVEEELEATGGTLVIDTKDIGGGLFQHTFTIENLVLTNENGEQIIDTNFQLGVFITN